MERIVRCSILRIAHRWPNGRRHGTWNRPGKAQPDWVAKQLARNPQWVNEQIKARQASQQDDLFAACDAGLPSQVPS